MHAGPVRARVFFALLTLAMTATAACENLGGIANGDDVAPPSRRDGGSDKETGAFGDGGGGGGGDAAGPTDRCDPIQPYGAPELQVDLDGAGKAKGAVMSSDGLEIFYLRQAQVSPWELRHGRRKSRGEQWEIFTDTLDPPASSGLSLAAGGLKLYFWNFAAANGQNYVATRQSPTQNFSGSQSIGGYPRPMFVAASDDSAYFSVIQEGGLEEVISRGNVVNGIINNFVPIANLHAASTYDTKPIVNESETVIYFSSARPDGLGSEDIYVARRPSKQSSFGAPTHSVELSSPQLDAITWVSNDDCEILIDRASHIYRATRPPLK